MFNTEKHLDQPAVRARCPHCYKLYSIRTSEINEPRPSFQCAECQGQFWIPFPESLEQAGGIIGFPIEAKPAAPAPVVERQESAEVPHVAFSSLPDFTHEIKIDREPPQFDIEPRKNFEAKPFSCPKCGEAYAGGESECVKCGVVFQKFFNKTPVRSDFSASKELKALWDAAVLEYEKEDRHRRFIQYGQTDSNLEYVHRKYQDVLEINPSDETAQKFAKETSALLHAKVDSELKKTESPLQKVFGSWRDVSIPRIRFSPVLIFIGAAIIATGLIVPGARNLIGFGSSILFLTLAVRYYFRRPLN